MPKMYLTRRESFSASHRLWNPSLTEARNIELFDKCASPNGHGHNYILEVTVAGQVRGETGYVIDLKKLKAIIRAEIIQHVDHKHLNFDVEYLKGIIPTAENLARVFWQVLEPKITEGKLFSIRLHETENNVIEYRGEE
jgi:6-pyruvoyltetrahydropterin/6-carboxytetrahydropterin synthase